MNERLLGNKTVIITGTSKGMGKQMVSLFSKNGANIFAHARTETDIHKEFCENLSRENGVRIIPIYFDLSDSEAIKNAVKEIRGYKLPIDGLVNNAGITYNALFQMTNIKDLREQFEINFFAPFLLTQYITKLMVREKAGSIVNISSSAAQDGNSGKSAYGSAKAALICMTKSIAEELGPVGIRANAICPGVTSTDMLDTMPDYILDIQKEASCLKRIGKPEDIANTAMFLISDLSKYITGQVFRVDGGVTNYQKRI